MALWGNQPPFFVSAPLTLTNHLFLSLVLQARFGGGGGRGQPRGPGRAQIGQGFAERLVDQDAAAFGAFWGRGALGGGGGGARGGGPGGGGGEQPQQQGGSIGRVVLFIFGAIDSVRHERQK